jgi:hypothetical protein
MFYDLQNRQCICGLSVSMERNVSEKRFGKNASRAPHVEGHKNWYLNGKVQETHWYVQLSEGKNLLRCGDNHQSS